MEESSGELTSRYYTAEIAIWTLSACLIISSLIGLDPSEVLPAINIKIANPQYIPHLIAATVVISSLYLYVEWKQSSQQARSRILSMGRFLVTLSCSATALWIAYPTITANTAFYGISPAWFVGFSLVGVIIGFFLGPLVFFSMMVLTREEAQRLKLPRMLRAIRAISFGFSLIIVVLIAIYIGMYFLAPPPVATLSPASTGFFAVFTALNSFLEGWHDKSGKRRQWREVVNDFKRINLWHHYEHRLIDRRELLPERYPASLSPDELQQQISRKISALYNEPHNEHGRIDFHCTTLDPLEINPIFKDGNHDNWSPANIALKFSNKNSKETNVRVLVEFDSDIHDKREVLVPLDLLEKASVKRLTNQCPDLRHSVPRAFLSEIVKDATINAICMDCSGLYHAAMAGREDYVLELLAAGAKVNEQHDFGWTPLLAAVAQGYVSIVRTLLEAGANPDIANVEGITPLLYGVRYRNVEIVRVLLEFGADANLADTIRETPLMVAVTVGSLEITDVLLNAGANPQICGLESKTALDLAYECGQGRIAQRLRRAVKGDA